jgi:hypothetical protein
MYFLKAAPPSPLNPTLSQEGEGELKFTHSWPKQFYVSPLNSRSGTYSLRTHDPFSPTQHGLLDTTITLSSAATTRPKLTARLFSSLPPSTPSTMSLPAKTLFLATWWWVGLATFPRTAKQAVTLLLLRGLRWQPRPEPTAATLARHADGFEVLVESLFARWLRSLVEPAAHAVTLRYIPSSRAGAETFTSRRAAPTPTAEALSIHVLAPSFYSALPRYPSALHGLHVEATRGTVAISDAHLTLLRALVPAPSPAPSSEALVARLALCERVQWRVIALLRSAPSELEAFALGEARAGMRRGYASRLAQMLVSGYVAFGWVEILDLEVWAVRVVGAWVLVGWWWGRG